MIESYKTITSISEGVYKEKGSKFLAYAHPVSSIEEAKKLNKWYRKEYYDARHHCFAYKINPLKSETRAADDGEPSNSAGTPILGQINSFGLVNVMIMVVRYFGGTKLGVGGLVNAYRSAAKDALESATIIDQAVTVKYDIKFSYHQMNDVMNLIKLFSIKIIKKIQELDCQFSLELEIKHQEQFEFKMTDLKINFTEIIN